VVKVRGAAAAVAAPAMSREVILVEAVAHPIEAGKAVKVMSLEANPVRVAKET
jgi:hypothetical protein